MKRILVSTLAVAVMLTAGNILAADFSQLTTEELNQMRGTMQNVSVEEREAFRTEWQNRMLNMTPEERQEYAGRPENAGQGQKQMMQQRQRIHQQSTSQGSGYGAGGSGARGGGGYGAGGGSGPGSGNGAGR